MKKQTTLRVLCRILAAIMLLSALAVPAMALTAHAEEAAPAEEKAPEEGDIKEDNDEEATDR